MKAVNTIGLSKSYGKRTALNDLNLSVEEGEFLGFLGPADSGKTTILRILSGMIPPTRGQCFICGRSIKDIRSVHQLCGAVTRSAGLYEYMGGLENLLFFSSVFGLDPVQARIRASALMKKLRVWDKRETPVSALNDGEKMRLSFARALLHQPKVLLCDMDSKLVDGESEKMICEVIAEENRDRGMTVCVFSQDLGNMEDYCTGYAVIDQGNLLATGSYEYLRGLSKLELICRIRCNKKPAGFRISGEYIEKEIGQEKEMPQILRRLIGEGADIFEAQVIYPKISHISSEMIKESRNDREKTSEPSGNQPD